MYQETNKMLKTASDYKIIIWGRLQGLSRFYQPL